MISVLHILTIFHILFTLLADYVQLHPLELCGNSTAVKYGHSYQETSGKTQTSSSKTTLALASQRHSRATNLEIGTADPPVGPPSLQGPSLHCTHQGSNGHKHIQFLEMPDLQENLQPSTPILRRLWCVVASMFRPDLSSSAEKPKSTKVSAMELCHRLVVPELGRTMAAGTNRRCAMDHITETPNTLQKKAIEEKQTEGSRASQGSKREEQRSGNRSRAFWSSSSSQCYSRPSMVIFNEHDCSHYASPCTSEHRRQAAQDHHGSSEEAQRSLASRAPVHGQRSCHQRGTTTNKTAACSRSCSWPSSKGTPAGPARSLQFAQCMARVFEPGCQAMARLQCPIPRPGKADERKSCRRHGNLGSSQGSIGKSKIDCRHRSQRRCDECQRRGSRKRSYGTGCRSHQGRTDEPPVQPRSSQKLSRANGRRRTESPQATQVGRWSSRHQFQAIRLALCASGVWLGRVNNTMELIAQRPIAHAVEVPPIIPKWMHTVQKEPNFVSEWSALDTAFHLAHELGTLPTPCSSGPHHESWELTACPVPHVAPIPIAIRSPRTCQSKVQFDNCLSVRIGDDSTNDFHEFAIQSCALSSKWKPWTLNSTCCHATMASEKAVTQFCTRRQVWYDTFPQPFLKDDQSVPCARLRSEEVLISQEPPTSFARFGHSCTAPGCRLDQVMPQEHPTCPDLHPTPVSLEVGQPRRTTRKVPSFVDPECKLFEASLPQPAGVDQQCPPCSSDHVCASTTDSPIGVYERMADFGFTFTPLADTQNSFDICPYDGKGNLNPADGCVPDHRGQTAAFNQVVCKDHFIKRDGCSILNDSTCISPARCQVSDKQAMLDCAATVTSHSGMVPAPTKARTYAKADPGTSSLEPRHRPKDTWQITHTVPHQTWRLEHESPIEEFTASLPEERQQIGTLL